MVKSMSKTELDIANEVMQGLWGVGDERKRRINKAGYDYNTVQSMVNQMITTGKTIKQVTISKEKNCGLVVYVEV